MDKYIELVIDILEILVNTLVDTFEDFFEALIIPTAEFTKDAFLVSLVFLIVSVIMEKLNVMFFVSWKEASSASAIMLVITLIDSSTRNNITKAVNDLKGIDLKNIDIKGKLKTFKQTKEGEVSDGE